MSTITLCLMVKNEEQFLEKCLKNVQSIVDDIFIMDTGSEDTTIDIAKQYTNNVWTKCFNNDFGAMRNEILEKVETEWVLFLDADEYFPNTDLYKIKNLLENIPNNVGGIRFYRYNFFATGGWYSNKVLKLFRNHPEFKYQKKVNESIDDSIINNGFSIIDSDIILNHVGHTRSRAERDSKSNKYIKLMQEQLVINPNDPVLHGYIGLISRTLGDFEFALKKTLDALNLKADSPTLNMFHAHVLRSMNRNEEALKAYKKSLEFRNNDAAILNMIGVMYMTLGDFSQAEKYFQKAYAINPILVHSLINKGLVKFFSNDYIQALKLFEKVIQRNPAFLYQDLKGILECDPYRAFYYETIMNYNGLESYIAICKDKIKEGNSYQLF
ncbi:glycosyltransferase [Bacillus cereus]|uniref:Tetratricopeptide repeat protein n=1 Tax=Bacillus cereus TaxID=1396 RepID=A0A9X8NTR7_BACCE|nr:glycosyltransferase family 2 protein [Bacillus cereus]RWQ71108.1 tetratricopeptide repeat protein [Bacillus cereus]